MHYLGNIILLFVSAVILHISLAIVCYALPLSGEMCSAVIPNTEGETRTILQKKTVLAFRSNCRQPEKYSELCVDKPHAFIHNYFLKILGSCPVEKLALFAWCGLLKSYTIGFF